MIALWRRHYPGYEQSLKMMTPQMVAEHYQRVLVAWSCERLAWEMTKASQSRFPFLNRFWLEYTMSAGVPLEMIAAQSHVPACMVRWCARRFGIVQAGWGWVLTGRGLAEKPRIEIEEQVGFEDYIFLRKAGQKILSPAEDEFSHA